MNKYVDAEKLIAEIEKQKKHLSESKLDERGAIIAYDIVLRLIHTLQQKQPEVDLVAELKHYLATTPKEQLEKDWKELEPWGNIGPTVQEFLYGKQPEGDLEKEIQKCWQNWVSPSNQNSVEGVLPKAEFAFYARHFYELGLKARK